MKEYEEIKLDVIKFDTEDVITTSPLTPGGASGQGGQNIPYNG